MVVTQRRQVQFDLTGDTVKPRLIDGQELPDWQKGPEMVEYIRQMREEGWQLTAGNSYVLVFERVYQQRVG